MIRYLIEIFVFQFLFLTVYEIWLKRDTFFNLNRAYLLITSLLSLLLPLIPIAFISEHVSTHYATTLPAIVLNNSIGPVSSKTVNWFSLIEWVWIIGSFGSALLFVWKLIRLHQLKSQGRIRRNDTFTLMELPGTDMAFSFWNIIFLGESTGTEKKKLHHSPRENTHQRKAQPGLNLL